MYFRVKSDDAFLITLAVPNSDGTTTDVYVRKSQIQALAATYPSVYQYPYDEGRESTLAWRREKVRALEEVLNNAIGNETLFRSRSLWEPHIVEAILAEIPLSDQPLAESLEGIEVVDDGGLS